MSGIIEDKLRTLCSALAVFDFVDLVTVVARVARLVAVLVVVLMVVLVAVRLEVLGAVFTVF